MDRVRNEDIRGTVNVGGVGEEASEHDTEEGQSMCWWKAVEVEEVGGGSPGEKSKEEIYGWSERGQRSLGEG